MSNRKTWTSDEIDHLQRIAAAGASCHVAERVLGKTTATIKRMARLWGIDLAPPSPDSEAIGGDTFHRVSAMAGVLHLHDLHMHHRPGVGEMHNPPSGATVRYAPALARSPIGSSAAMCID